MGTDPGQRWTGTLVGEAILALQLRKRDLAAAGVALVQRRKRGSAHIRGRVVAGTGLGEDDAIEVARTAP